MDQGNRFSGVDSGRLRLLLRILQVMTTIPYRKSNSHSSESEYQFSVSLFLCRFLILLLNCVTAYLLTHTISKFTGTTVGTFFFVSIVGLQAFLYFALFSFVVGSKQILLLMQDVLKALQHRVQELPRAKSFNMMDILLVLVSLTLPIFFVMNNYMAFLVPNVYFAFLLDISFAHVVVELSSITVLFRFICADISNLLLSTVIKGNQVIDDLLSRDMMTQSKSRQQQQQHKQQHKQQQQQQQRQQLETADRELVSTTLLEMEHCVYEVEEFCSRTSKGFFIIITSFTGFSTLMNISLLFSFIDGKFRFPGIFLFLCFFNLFPLSFYEAGHRFICNMEKAMKEIRKISLATSDHIIKTQISHLVALLERLCKFEMCGWYTLDYKTLLSLWSLILTYLVILLQVGGAQTTFREEVTS